MLGIDSDRSTDPQATYLSQRRTSGSDEGCDPFGWIRLISALAADAPWAESDVFDFAQ